jgi:hypothetical protein
MHMSTHIYVSYFMYNTYTHIMSPGAEDSAHIGDYMGDYMGEHLGKCSMLSGCKSNQCIVLCGLYVY